jgi:multisubunit Na+/H+ antiporter MnhG subunit
MNPHSSDVLNYYILRIIGIFCEGYGTFFLSLEAIGIERFTKFYGRIHKASKWLKKNKLRAIIASLLGISPVVLIIELNTKPFSLFLIPSAILLLVYITIIDTPAYFENLVLKKQRENKIGPYGFIIMLIGFLFHLISVIWEMCVVI